MSPTAGGVQSHVARPEAAQGARPPGRPCWGCRAASGPRTPRIPRRAASSTARGPTAPNSSRPTLAMPNQGRSTRASPNARSRSSVSSAFAQRVGSNGSGACVGERFDVTTANGAAGRSGDERLPPCGEERSAVTTPPCGPARCAAPVRSPTRRHAPAPAPGCQFGDTPAPGARGEAKVAVPTCTARAPAISISTASAPRATPPDSHDRQVAERRVRTPRRPAPPAGGWPVPTRRRRRRPGPGDARRRR